MALRTVFIVNYADRRLCNAYDYKYSTGFNRIRISAHNDMVRSSYKKRNEFGFLNQGKIAEVNANIETAISGVRVSRSYTSESHETAKFEKANEHLRRHAAAYRAM